MTRAGIGRLAGGAVALAVLSACSVPGLHFEDPRDEGGAWYASAEPRHPSAQPPEQKEYDPVIHDITPQLIAKQRRDEAPSDKHGKGKPRLPNGDPNPHYRVGPGDLLAIIVFGHPDITNPAGTTQSFESSGRLVDADGNIFVPFIGELEVAGHSVDTIRKRIAKGLSDVIRDPQVDVRVLQYRSQKVYVTGDISRPCTVPIRDVAVTVVDALDACQSLLSERDPGVSGVNAVQLVRDGQTYPIDISELYREGGQPIRLKDGDRIIVDDSFNRIFIVGEFAEQTAAPYSAGGMTLADAIAAGGGLNLETADPGAIYVIRGFVDAESEPGEGVETRIEPHIYHLDASSIEAMILADQFQLQPRDVVFAGPADLVNFNRALAQITPSLDVLFRSFLIFDRAGD